ncbi:MAG: sodium:alanine symporter family protein [Oscillospiraceae bacterium]|nr:sodium:alanine symporter family protein [Oscillospiraceae bacterium]
MAGFLDFANKIVWGAPALVLILGVGLYLSIRTGFAQLRLFPKALRQFFRRFRQKETDDGVSPFQALCTALAATVGTGNLVGVAGAIALGGPGAIFWMWVCATLGMVTKFAEATLAVRYRVKENGEYLGGPMYMIREGLPKGLAWLGCVYAFFGVIAAFGVGNATQINAVVTGINQVVCAFGGEESVRRNLGMGILLALLIGSVLLGGGKRIGRAAELLVPFASCAYLLLCAGVLILRASAIPDAFGAIIHGAFSPKAVTGGTVGSFFQALRIGVSRGVFTNEAGMGTASIAHASAEVSHPAEQGMMGILEVFLDTIVICTMTALVILCSNVPVSYGTDAGAELTSGAFISVYGEWVSIVLAAALCCFAFATVLGWGLYGIRCAQFLFGENCAKIFCLLQCGMVILSSVMQTGIIWSLAETVNGLMAIPNLLALVGLSPEIRKLTFEYHHLCGPGAAGGTYENLNQRKPLSAFSHAKVPSLRTGSQETG